MIVLFVPECHAFILVLCMCLFSPFITCKLILDSYLSGTLSQIIQVVMNGKRGLVEGSYSCQCCLQVLWKRVWDFGESIKSLISGLFLACFRMNDQIFVKNKSRELNISILAFLSKYSRRELVDVSCCKIMLGAEW